MTIPANDNPPDLLLGADAIAKFLGVSRRQAYRLAADTDLPTFKLGGTVAASRATLAAWIARQGTVAA